MVLMVLSDCAAINARKLTTWSVLLQKKKKTSSSPFFAPLMSVGSRDEVKRVTLKRVIFSFHSGEAKDNKKGGEKSERRETNSSKKDCICRERQEQLWKVEDLDRAFDLWEKICPLRRGCPRTRLQRKQACPTPPSVKDCQEDMEEEREGRLQGKNGLPRF